MSDVASAAGEDMQGFQNAWKVAYKVSMKFEERNATLRFADTPYHFPGAVT